MKKGKTNYLLVIMVVFTVAMIYVWEQIQSVRLQYMIEEINEQKSKELENAADFQILCIKMESPERLDRLASERKFYAPKKENVRIVN
ncbi:MAG: hypothetical protein A2252_10465 [Elusimicrobia bacterium RIFOXYA2_FULL_39_19]|nr:MAG: hypothetical protein A2252_10465 [Elusimicrobia bacterium RIFOXYA2_FULL_39_19]